MIRTTGNRGFTLIELLVVVGMIALIMGALTSAFSSSLRRAKIQKATTEVGAIAQAFLAYENLNKDHEIDPVTSWKDFDVQSFGYLLGHDGKTVGGEKIPVLVQAALSTGGVMRDPWGMPYRVMINKGTIKSPSMDSVRTGYYLQNFNTLTKKERQ